MIGSRLAVVLLLTTLTVVVLSVRSEAKRIALVIGNANYQHFARLKNTGNDAELMSLALREVGFEVTMTIDADQRTLKRAFLEFSRAIRTDVEATFIFYAGHGVQVDGENYLMPVDANVTSEDEVPLEGINANDFLQVLRGSTGQVNVVVLDACRNNPFPSAVRSLNQGLAPVLAPRGTFIAYSTAPGTVAYDGASQNSEFAIALADAMRVPGLEISQVFRRVRQRVLDATLNEQTPWDSSSIVGDFYFKPAPQPSAAEPANLELQAAKQWGLVRNSSDPVQLSQFIAKFPGSPFADLATARLRSTVENDVLVVGQEPTPSKPEETSTTKSAVALNWTPKSKDDRNPQSAPNVEPALRINSKENFNKAVEAAQHTGTLRGWLLFLLRFGDHPNATDIVSDEIKKVAGATRDSKEPAHASVETLLLQSDALRTEVQRGLNARGFDVGTIDAAFGERTRTAISAFQSANGFVVTSYIDPPTLKKLGIQVLKNGKAGDFVSRTARTYSTTFLEVLGEDPRIIELVRCMWPRTLVYGRFNARVYAAILDTVRNEFEVVEAKLASCGLQVVSVC